MLYNVCYLSNHYDNRGYIYYVMKKKRINGPAIYNKCYNISHPS